jgi:hypothetical protein
MNEVKRASQCACNVNASLRLHSVANWVPMLLRLEEASLSNLLRIFRHKVIVSSSGVEMSKKNAGGRWMHEYKGIA